MNKHNKGQLGYYIVSMVVFVIAGFFVITYASGYKIDITNRNISQMGMVVVETDANIELNGKYIDNKDTEIRNLAPGEYNVRLYKDGYHDWTRSFELSPGEAEIINDAILFKTEIEPIEYKIESTDFFDKLADKDGLALDGSEIIENGNFVTRLSKAITGLCWYSDRRYIAYTYENHLKIIQIDGTNNIDLLEKKSESPVVFLKSGRFVVYESDEKIFKAEIR
jgi:hypothetical protein